MRAVFARIKGVVVISVIPDLLFDQGIFKFSEE